MTPMRWTRRDLLRAAAAASIGCASRAQEPIAAVRSHLDRIVSSAADVYGPRNTPMWVASLDTRTGRYPEDAPKARAGQRVYRQIDAPFGSTIYWDQPQLVAAHAVAKLTGERKYARAAQDYVRYFLAHCVDADGLFEWGAHRYYDVFQDEAVRFTGGYHEMRPIPPAWQLFWDASPKITARAIEAIRRQHIFDAETGGFNRHGDGKPGHAFFEAGGILAETLAWYARRARRNEFADVALRVAQYSFRSRNPETGLLENDPTSQRWDKLVCTSEVGLWAGCLLRAGDLTGREEFIGMARDALLPWLRYGFDSKAKRYYGQLRVKDGMPVLTGKQPGPTEYYPGDYSDIWNANFPTHDYPMALAEACLELCRRTRAEEFEQAVHRWAAIVEESTVPETAAHGRGAYAELFGRQMHFLVGAAETFGNESYRQAAHRLAAAAMKILFTNGMFRGHAGEDRYDAVDGVGYLLLALLYLETGRRDDYFGFGF